MKKQAMLFLNNVNNGLKLHYDTLHTRVKVEYALFLAALEKRA
jgi:hypothetical protein